MSTEYAHLCECPQPTPYQVGGFLPSSSLSPRALVGEVSSLSPTQTVGGLWAPPRRALQPGDSPPPGLSPEGRDASSFFSFPKQAEGDCCGKWYCTAGSVPSASHSSEQAGLPPESGGPRREGLLMGWPPTAGPAASSPFVLRTGESTKG